MDCSEETSIPVRNVLVMFAMAAGTWVLIYLTVAGFVGLWPRHVPRSEVALGDPIPTDVAVPEPNVQEKDAHVASLQHSAQWKMRALAPTKVKRKKRRPRSLAARIFDGSTSIN